MLSLVKSFFLKSSEDPSEDEAGFQDTQERNNFIDDSHDQEPVEKLPRGAERFQDDFSNPLARASLTSEKEQSKELQGALYTVSGLDFSCLMARAVATFDNSRLIFEATDSAATKPKRLAINIQSISMIRQHLPDAFQFMVRDANEGGEEYGFQLDHVDLALSFRKLLYVSILKHCTSMFEIQCAIAEYDTINKEFLIITKAAVAQILQKNKTQEYYIVVSDTAEDDDAVRIISLESLTREIQVWPSPQTLQITLWAVRFEKADNKKTMFLLEVSKSVDKAVVEEFFKILAIILQDRSFLMPGSSLVDIDPKHQLPPEPMEDDFFEKGPMHDDGYRKKWKTSRKSRYSANETAESGGSSDEEDDFKGSSAIPRYLQESTAEHLTHRFMEVGKHRTFVCRGNQPTSQSYRDQQKKADKVNMKVYKRSDDDGTLESVGAIAGSKFTYRGEKFIPGMGLLHDHEAKLLLAPESNNQGNLYLMDLEKETVVQKWNANDTQINTMFPTSKQAQLTHDPTFLCTNPRNLFLVDTRLPENAAKATNFSYKTNPQISVGATDSAGHILLGSRFGELRLFDGQARVADDTFKRAKTLLETIKEPITAVDVTNDGSWILATTKAYLVVFPTKISSTGRTGFEVALGKQKPNPIYLMLNADDVVKHRITDINFAPAHFDADEDCIVTSTGNMAIVWDFSSVKRGKPFYSVRFAEDTIKDVQIPLDASDVVVAYPTAVGLFETEKKVL